MKVTLVNLTAPPTALHRPSLTPELMAATGARYSRNNEGLDEILSKIDWDNTDKSVDSIFRMVDYGHASIADMSPVTMFIDDISILAAFWLWHISPTASGQESSTRYIRYNSSSMMDQKEVNIDGQDLYVAQSSGYLAYEKARTMWEDYSKTYPDEMNISEESKSDEKKYKRLVRNFGFDRARVFLPVSAKTNVMMIMSARSWVDVISYMLSFPCKEFNQIGEALKSELNCATPRLTKHAHSKESTTKILKHNLEQLIHKKHFDYNIMVDDSGGYCHVPFFDKDIMDLLDIRENRYAGFTDTIRMTPVRFGWSQSGFAEIRDVNRHRTGSKRISWYPNGFHSCADQCIKDPDLSQQLLEYAEDQMRNNFEMCVKYLKEGNFEGLYLLSLGHTFEWQHITTLDKFIYQAELRTGIGAHYAYARMMMECVGALENSIPGISGKMLLGTGEAE